jgi:hypothetical protein
MPVIPIIRPAAVATELLDGEPADNKSADPVRKCGRCRLNFVRHPSIDLDNSTKWWLCPPCRIRLLGDASETNSRWT